MIEEGGIYKLKKIKDFRGTNTEDDFKVLKISGDTVYCQNQETKELNMFNKKDFIDPEFPDDIYSDIQIVWEKLNTKMHPMNLSFWKDLKEEMGGMVAASAVSGGMGSMGAMPCPAMGQITGGNVSGCLVNGIPVAGQSIKKKKKKKSKKNEATFSGIVIEQEEIENFNINEVKKYFKQNIQQQNIYNYCLKDNIKIVNKTWTETQSHKGKTPLFLLFKQLDYILATAYGNNTLVNNTKNRIDNINGWYYLFNTVLFGNDLLKIKLDIAQSSDGKKVYFLSNKKETASGTPSNIKECCHVGRNTASNNIIHEKNEIVNTYGLELNKEYDLTPFFHITLLKTNIQENMDENYNKYIVQGNVQKPHIEINSSLVNNAKSLIQKYLTEDFHEEYDSITEQISKYLDKLNFKYANTEDIIYKKEGNYKYLFKFDNGEGFIKIKVLKDDEILIEKEYKIDETADIQPIFDEIEQIYKKYGL